MSLQRCEGSDLEDVLAHVRARWGDEATIVEANKLRKGGVAGFFARERFEVVVDTDQVPAGPAGQGSSSPPSLEDRLLGLADSVSDAERAEAPTPDLSTEHTGFAQVLETLSRQLRDNDPPVPVPAGQVAPAGPVGLEALLRVGLPDELARPGHGLESTDPARRLAEVLEYVPAPPRLPTGRGAVVAVVGDRQAGIDLAHDLAGRLRVDPETLELASPGYRGRAVPEHRRIDSAELAAEHRRSWRRRSRATVVAVEARPGQHAAWARLVLDALEPTMVWAAVDASRKPEDIVAWAEHLGGVDALAVTGLDDTVSPASILRCGIPVGRLDGRPATPALWAALLTPRLTTGWSQ